MYFYIKYNILRLLSCRKKDNLQPHVEPGDIFCLCYSIVQRAGDNTDILPLILQKVCNSTNSCSVHNKIEF